MQDQYKDRVARLRVPPATDEGEAVLHEVVIGRNGDGAWGVSRYEGPHYQNHTKLTREAGCSNLLVVKIEDEIYWETYNTATTPRPLLRAAAVRAAPCCPCCSVCSAATTATTGRTAHASRVRCHQRPDAKRQDPSLMLKRRCNLVMRAYATSVRPH